MKILIFGAGKWGHILLEFYRKRSKDAVVGFVDNNIDYSDGNIKVYKATDIPNIDFDKIIIAVRSKKTSNDILKQLYLLQVPQNKIFSILEDDKLLIDVFAQRENIYDEFSDPRVGWLRNFSSYAKAEEIIGNVAECGVYMGDFAAYINKYFFDRKLYLFDTFEGFSTKDLEVERDINDERFLSSEFNSKDKFHANNEEIVRKKMLYLDNVEIHKGYFPETAVSITDKFCFVNLDMDLYKPMLAGLEWFYPQMSAGGVLLLHDYFNIYLPGVRKAVMDYENKYDIHLSKVPIGDGVSIAIIKAYV